jgi:GH43 family beta-xylosidase
MNDDLLSYDESTVKFLFRAEDEWELKDCSVVEGPFVLKHKGKYYLTYSANHTRSPFYAIGCAIADNPFGPFTQVDYNPILAKTDTVDGPGHHSFTTSKDGKRLICVYHTHNQEGFSHGRQTCIDPAEFVPNPNGGDDILVIHGPTRGPQPLIC